MAKQKDYSYLINTAFGSLTVQTIFRLPSKRAVLAECQCSCGNKTKTTSVHALLSGKTTMCKKCSSKINGLKGLASAIKRGNEYIGQVFNYFTVLAKASVEEAGEAGKYRCQCICGTIKYLDLCALKNTSGKGSKSCGCQQSRLLSLAAGGTGIPNQTVSINEFIRKQTIEYTSWVKECLLQSNFTCAITGQSGGKLNVHHISPLCHIIKEHKITIDNYLTFKDILFNPNNGIVITEKLHREFHNEYGNDASLDDLLLFKEIYLNKLARSKKL